jgi:hypothetical protein
MEMQIKITVIITSLPVVTKEKTWGAAEHWPSMLEAPGFQLQH